MTDRDASTRTNVVTRTRLKAVAAGAAFAFIVGLSGSAAAYASETTAPQASGTEVVAEATAAALVDATTVGADQTAAAAPAEAPAPAAPAEAPPAPAAAPPAAPAAAPAPAGPAEGELFPVGVTAAQQRFTPSAEQMSNARAIVDAGKAMGLPPRAWVIAVSTSLQESNLKNIGHLGDRNDHDSLGLFQQRPSSGWGTPAQITDPTYSATAFYKGLVGVPAWNTLPLTTAAQKVQISAYPDHYAKHESQAGDIIRGLYGQGPYAGIAG